MIDYLKNILPRLKQKAKILDNIESFVDKPWVLIKENGEQEKFLFRRNNSLIISRQGNVIKATWEYLDFDRSVLIDIEETSLLLNQGFILDGLMVLKKDGTNELHPFVNQNIIPDLDLVKYLVNLEKSNESNVIKPAKKNFIRTYNKGQKITIHQNSLNINPGDKVFLNENEKIPNGKYKVGFMLSIIVENGLVISVK